MHETLMKCVEKGYYPATNQGVGSSNLSGRANKIKRLVAISADRFLFGLSKTASVVAPIVALELGFAAVGHFA